MSRFSKPGAQGFALVTAAALLLAAAAAAPYVLNFGTEAALAESATELAFLESKRTQAKGAKPAGLTASDNIDRLFVSGSTAGLALAGLQRTAGGLAASHGLQVERSQPLPAESRDGIAVLRMDMQFSGSLEGLRGYLHAIETGEPLMFVNQLKVSANDRNEGLPSDNLAIGLQIEAYAAYSDKP